MASVHHIAKCLAEWGPGQRSKVRGSLENGGDAVQMKSSDIPEETREEDWEEGGVSFGDCVVGWFAENQPNAVKNAKKKLCIYTHLCPAFLHPISPLPFAFPRPQPLDNAPSRSCEF